METCFCFFSSFFLCFLLILRVIQELFHRLWDLISPAALQGMNGSWGAAFVVTRVGLKTPTDLCVVVPNRHGHVGPVKFACFVSIDCTDFFFQCYLCFFFYSEKRNTKKKKFIKRLEKNTTQKTILSRATHCIQNKNTFSVSTQTSTAVSLLTASLEIRLIRFRKIIIKLMNRVGKQNTAWQALLQTHTHTCTSSCTHTHAHSSWNYMFCSQIFFHSRNLATVV